MVTYEQLQKMSEDELLNLFGLVVDAIGDKHGVDVYEMMKGDLWDNIQYAINEREKE